MTFARLLPVALMSLVACREKPVCNRHAALCGLRYDQVSFPGTHDAYSDKEEKFGAPDQTYPPSRQLADGVRVLHLEAQEFDGEAMLCHGFCTIGSKPLVAELVDVADFLDTHPGEVVTLLMEQSKVPVEQIVDAFRAVHLDTRAHAHAPGTPWATLGALLDAGTPLVVFLDETTPDAPFLHDRWRYTWETPWDNRRPEDFLRCNADRGQSDNDLYVVDNYYEDMILPTPAGAERVNLHPFLVDRVTHCRSAAGRLPNFVMVNYYEVGELFAVVDAMNGFSSPATPDWDAFPARDAGAGLAPRD